MRRRIDLWCDNYHQNLARVLVGSTHTHSVREPISACSHHPGQVRFHSYESKQPRPAAGSRSNTSEHKQNDTDARLHARGCSQKQSNRGICTRTPREAHIDRRMRGRYRASPTTQHAEYKTACQQRIALRRVRACLASHGRRGKCSSNRDQAAACIPGQRETGRSQRSVIQPNNASVELPQSEASTAASRCRLNSDSYTSQRCRRSVIPEPRVYSGGLRQLCRTCPQRGAIHLMPLPPQAVAGNKSSGAGAATACNNLRTDVKRLEYTPRDLPHHELHFRAHMPATTDSMAFYDHQGLQAHQAPRTRASPLQAPRPQDPGLRRQECRSSMTRAGE